MVNDRFTQRNRATCIVRGTSGAWVVHRRLGLENQGAARSSDVVNRAHGLAPDELRLMWATAQPRMPLTPDLRERPQVQPDDQAAK